MTNKDESGYILFLKRERERLHHERMIWVLSVALVLESVAWITDIAMQFLK